MVHHIEKKFTKENYRKEKFYFYNLRSAFKQSLDCSQSFVIEINHTNSYNLYYIIF